MGVKNALDLPKFQFQIGSIKRLYKIHMYIISNLYGQRSRKICLRSSTGGFCHLTHTSGGNGRQKRIGKVSWSKARLIQLLLKNSLKTSSPPLSRRMRTKKRESLETVNPTKKDGNCSKNLSRMPYNAFQKLPLW